MSSNSIPPQRRVITRRELLKGIGLMSGLLAVAACAPAAQPAQTAQTAEQPSAGTAEATTPATSAEGTGGKKRGGVFRLAHQDDFTTLDVAQAYGYVDWWASAFLLYDRLYTYDNELNFVPILAAGMPEVSADGLKITIPLKKGVKFHDGTEMKAEDVKFSIERSLLPNHRLCRRLFR